MSHFTKGILYPGGVRDVLVVHLPLHGSTLQGADTHGSIHRFYGALVCGLREWSGDVVGNVPTTCISCLAGAFRRA